MSLLDRQEKSEVSSTTSCPVRESSPTGLVPVREEDRSKDRHRMKRRARDEQTDVRIYKPHRSYTADQMACWGSQTLIVTNAVVRSPQQTAAAATEGRKIPHYLSNISCVATDHILSLIICTCGYISEISPPSSHPGGCCCEESKNTGWVYCSVKIGSFVPDVVVNIILFPWRYWAVTGQRSLSVEL